MVGALDIFSIELAAVERHAAMGTGIAQGKGLAHAVAADHERNLKQHGFVKLIAMDPVGGQSAIPEAGEHERIGAWRWGGSSSGMGEDCRLLDF
jgi:hypothetical protein